MYLLDNNALSELRRMSKNKANRGFANWVNSVDSNLFFINSIVVLEQQKWVLTKYRKDPIQGNALEKWLAYVLTIFEDKILLIDNQVALKCAELHVPDPRPQFDSLIASTALVHDLILVTRNVKDFETIEGLRWINPFD